MTQFMLGESLREFRGPMNDFEVKLQGENGPEWWKAFKRFLRQENPWGPDELAILAARKLFKELAPVPFLAALGDFIVREHFVLDTKPTAKMKISYLGDNFKSWFSLVQEGGARPAGQFFPYTLKEDSLDPSILKALGDEPNEIKTSLGSIFSLMLKQGNKEDGPLLTSGAANIFYVEDILRLPEDEGIAYLNEKNERRVLRAVDVRWSDDGWDVYARSVLRLDRWSAGGRVFSRRPWIAQTLSEVT